MPRAQEEFTIEEHARNIIDLGHNLAFYALMEAVEITVEAEAAAAREVEGMKSLLAKLVQRFAYHGGGRHGVDPDGSKSAAVVDLLLDSAAARIWEQHVTNLSGIAALLDPGTAPGGVLAHVRVYDDDAYVQSVVCLVRPADWKLLFVDPDGKCTGSTVGGSRPAHEALTEHVHQVFGRSGRIGEVFVEGVGQ
jgi:hypothetical protein